MVDRQRGAPFLSCNTFFLPKQTKPTELSKILTLANDLKIRDTKTVFTQLVLSSKQFRQAAKTLLKKQTRLHAHTKYAVVCVKSPRKN